MGMETNPVLRLIELILEGNRTGWVINLGLISLLLILSLFFPPVSLGQKILAPGYPTITEEGGSIADPDGTLLTVLPGSRLQVQFTSIPRLDFLEGTAGEPMAQAAAAIPANLVMKSPLYKFDVRGELSSEAILEIPIPNDAGPLITLDLYTWTGEEWQWLPSRVTPEADRIEAHLSFIPPSVAVMQSKPIAPTVSAELSMNGAVPSEGRTSLVEINPLGLYVKSDGSDGSYTIGGEVESWQLPGQDSPYIVLPTLSNEMQGVIRNDLVDNIIANGDLRRKHIAEIVDLVVGNMYAGIDIDYRGVAPDLRNEFATFITELAHELHEHHKLLTVRVSPPSETAGGSWDTGVFDWRTIGQAADGLKIPSLPDPGAYAPLGPMERLLRYAVSEVNRYKIQPLISTRSRDRAGDTVTEISYAQALALIGQEDEESVDLPRLREEGDINFDEGTRTYWYTYQDEGGVEHTVWLENADSIGPKLELAAWLNLKGVALRGLLEEGNDKQVWEPLRQFQGWARIEEGAEVRREMVPTPTPTPSGPLSEVIIDDGESGFSKEGAHWWEESLGHKGDMLWTYVNGDTVESWAKWRPAFPECAAYEVLAFIPEQSVSTTSAKYEIHHRDGETTVSVNQKDEAGTWVSLGTYNFDKGTEGYVRLTDATGESSGTLRQIGFDALKWVLKGPCGSATPVAMAAFSANLIATPTPEAEETETISAPKVEASEPTPTPEPTSTPEPAAPPPRSTDFDYGIQVHMFHTDHGRVTGAVRDIGFNWIKQQIEWKYFEPAKGQYAWGDIDALVNSCNAAGIKVMLSVVKAPAWARATQDEEGPPVNYQDYADFVRALASRYKGKVQAYEIWNEQNLRREWNTGRNLSASEYVELLKVAYNAIKAVDPNAIVVSGGLTPTGWSDYVIAIDDVVYLEEMYQAGLKNYSDAIGAHPSGFNVPPDVGWQDACAAITADGASFRGPCDAPHRSWCFRSTMESYHNVMVKYGDGNKKIWPTEFGWASAPPVVEGWDYAIDNTWEEQAEWIVKAYQMANNWGWVGVMFLWNLNFCETNPGWEGGAFSILGRPAYTALKAARASGTLP